MKKIFKDTKKNEEIISMNTDLYDEFFVQELESRLETDPLMLGGLMELFGTCNNHYLCNGHCQGYEGCGSQCNSFTRCTEYSSNYI
jgi:hypothetical protein